MVAYLLWLVALVSLVSFEGAAMLPACGDASGVGFTIPPPPPAASCASYSDILPDGSLGFCAGIVDYEFYLPQGATQSQLEVQAENSLTQGDATVGLLLQILPPSCTAQLKRASCLAAFQGCALIDPFFLDGEQCGPGEYCVACGNATTISPSNGLAPVDPSPAYGSVCTADGISFSVPKLCSVGPGKQAGLGNMPYSTARVYVNNTLTMDQYCQSIGLVYSSSADSCFAVIPKTACKGQCDPANYMEPHLTTTPTGVPALNASCPLISGNFTLQMQALAVGLATTDPYVQSQATKALATAQSGRITTSLLTAFGLAPNCNQANPVNSDIFLFSDTYISEFTANGNARNVSVGLLIASKVNFWLNSPAGKGDKCHCTNDFIVPPDVTENTDTETCTLGMTCAELASFAQCNNAGNTVAPNTNIRFVEKDGQDVDPICKEVISHPSNQPENATLDLLKVQYGLSNREEAMGAFFVPPAPGLPPLAGGQMDSQQQELCSISNQIGNGEVFTGNDSYSCTVATVKSISGVVPPFVSSECRVPYLDLVCNQAHMKLEYKTLCLVNDQLGGCAADPVTGSLTAQIPFIFALPRFPGKALCQLFKSECAGFIDSLGPAQKASLEAAIDCDGVIEQTCAKSHPTWTSDVWNCSSSFNGLPSYPDASQVLADLTPLLGEYALNNGLVGLATLGSTSVSEKTFSNTSAARELGGICSCPYPLVVPDDLDAPTIAEGVCCQQRCEGHNFSPDEQLALQNVMRIVPWFSFFGAGFIFLTWSCFRVKRSQPLTLLFGFTSMMICTVFLIPSYASSDLRDVWCKDNTQPNIQGDGGICEFQSVWLPYWTMVACCLWGSQAIDLYLKIVLNKRHIEYLTKYYAAASFGYPFATVIVAASTNALGYESNQFWCFLREHEDNGLRLGLDLGLFYGSIVSITLIGTILMILVLVHIARVTGKTASTAQGNTFSKRMQLYRTPVFFVFFFVYVWISIFTWRFDAAAKELSIVQGAGDWISCLLANYGAGIEDPATSPSANISSVEKYGITNGSGCGVQYPNGIPYGSFLYVLMILSLQGVFVFMIYGLKLENFNLWRERMGLTSAKFDTGPKDESSTTKDRSGNPKPSILSNAMSAMFSPGSPSSPKNNSSDHGGGSAVMIDGLRSGKFMAVTGEKAETVKPNQVAAYMSGDE